MSKDRRARVSLGPSGVKRVCDITWCSCPDVLFLAPLPPFCEEGVDAAANMGWLSAMRENDGERVGGDILHCDGAAAGE